MSLPGKIKNVINKFHSPSLKTYGSFQQAQEASGMGYEDHELIEVLVSKTIQNRHLLNNDPYFNNASLSSLTSVLYCFQQFDTVNIIDLGGSTGIQYHIIRQLIDKRKRMNWHVVESPALAKRCASLFTTEELSFSDDLEKAINSVKELHLIHSSGVIQYMPDPYQTLKAIANSNSSYLNFARMCFSKKENEMIILQESPLSANGFGPLPPSFKDRTLSYPQTSILKQKFFSILEQRYKTMFTYQDDSGAHYPWQEGLGVFMTRRN